MFRLFLGVALAICCSIQAVADVRINEFMAANDTVLADDDGDHSDWIELYNSGQAVDLRGWYLTDDADNLTRWKLPAVNLPADSYLLIYASGKDRVAGGAIHTNFKLGKGGEYLGLITADGNSVVSEFTPTYPGQNDDVSYGFAQGPDTRTTEGYLLRPTPGEQNSALAPPGLSLVPRSGVFTDAQNVAIQTDSELPPGHVIRYTTDGTDPSSSSAEYSRPITLTSSAIVRAAVFKGGESFAITGGQYIEYSTNLTGFDSTLPIVVIDTFRQNPNTQSDDYRDAAFVFLDHGEDILTQASSAQYLGFGGIRQRGASSDAFPKKSFKLELWDVDRDDSDADLYGMGAESDWLLVAPGNQDRSYIANPFMADLAGDIGLSALNWRYVEVFLNRDNGSVSPSDYVGIYLLFETIKIGENRIDLADLEADDGAEPGISGGYIFKRDRSDVDELAFSPGAQFNRVNDATNQVVVHRPKLEDMNSRQTDWFEQHIRQFESALLGNQPLHQRSGYRAYIEEDSWIDAHLLHLMAKNGDMLKWSNYFYKDKNQRMVNGPLWDFDRSLNSADRRDDDPGNLSHSLQVDPFVFSWWGELFAVPHFEEKHRRRWHVLRRGPLADESLFKRIDALASPLFGPYTRENARWGDAFDDYGSRYGNLQGEIDELKVWLATRLAFMDTFLTDPGVPDCSSSTLDYTLPGNTWALLSLPCEPPAGATLATVFGDDVSGVYGYDWVVYVFDPALGENGDYKLLSDELLPRVGQGFWMLQTNDSLAILDLPDDSRPVSSGPFAQPCIDSQQGRCSTVGLPAGPGWAMLGNAHREAVAMSAIRIAGASGPCASGCTLPAGRAANVLPSSLFTYDREVSRHYHRLADVGVLNEWDGFWVFTGPNSGTTTHTLQMPLSR